MSYDRDESRDVKAENPLTPKQDNSWIEALPEITIADQMRRSRRPIPNDESKEPQFDALLDHVARRLVSFLDLPEKRTGAVADGLKLIREELAIWTMHDLPRTPSQDSESCETN